MRLGRQPDKLKKAQDKLIAGKLMEQLETKGQVNLTQLVKEVKPHVKAPNAHCHEVVTSGVVSELHSLFDKRYPDLKEKITPEFVLEQLTFCVEKLKTLSETTQDPDIMIKALNGLDAKLEKLGKYLGIWRVDKPQEVDEALEDRFSRLFGEQGRN